MQQNFFTWINAKNYGVILFKIKDTVYLRRLYCDPVAYHCSYGVQGT